MQLLNFVQASNLPDWEPPAELVEGMLIERTMSVVYGDSNTGKSFLVLDMAAHISIGMPWFGRQVKRGRADKATFMRNVPEPQAHCFM